MTFDRFIADLTKNRFVGAWKNNPDQFSVRPGTAIDVDNIGGETHTFTRVAAFGGGIVFSAASIRGCARPSPSSRIDRFPIHRPAAPLPATTVVSANTSVAYFPVTTSRVGANITVTITATACCGTQGTATGAITVTTAAPPPPDVVTIQSAQFKFVGGRGGLLNVKARSTKATAILSVFTDGSTESTLILTNTGGGSFEGSFQFHSPGPANVTVKSNLGGSASARVR